MSPDARVPPERRRVGASLSPSMPIPALEAGRSAWRRRRRAAAGDEAALAAEARLLLSASHHDRAALALAPPDFAVALLLHDSSAIVRARAARHAGRLGADAALQLLRESAPRSRARCALAHVLARRWRRDERASPVDALTCELLEARDDVRAAAALLPLCGPRVATAALHEARWPLDLQFADTWPRECSAAWHAFAMRHPALVLHALASSTLDASPPPASLATAAARDPDAALAALQSLPSEPSQRSPLQAEAADALLPVLLARRTEDVAGALIAAKTLPRSHVKWSRRAGAAAARSQHGPGLVTLGVLLLRPLLLRLVPTRLRRALWEAHEPLTRAGRARVFHRDPALVALLPDDLREAVAAAVAALPPGDIDDGQRASFASVTAVAETADRASARALASADSVTRCGAVAARCLGGLIFAPGATRSRNLLASVVERAREHEPGRRALVSSLLDGLRAYRVVVAAADVPLLLQALASMRGGADSSSALHCLCGDLILEMASRLRRGALTWLESALRAWRAALPEAMQLQLPALAHEPADPEACTAAFHAALARVAAQHPTLDALLALRCEGAELVLEARRVATALEPAAAADLRGALRVATSFAVDVAAMARSLVAPTAGATLLIAAAVLDYADGGALAFSELRGIDRSASRALLPLFLARASTFNACIPLALEDDPALLSEHLAGLDEAATARALDRLSTCRSLARLSAPLHALLSDALVAKAAEQARSGGGSAGDYCRLLRVAASLPFASASASAQVMELARACVEGGDDNVTADTADDAAADLAAAGAAEKTAIALGAASRLDSDEGASVIVAALGHRRSCRAAVTVLPRCLDVLAPGTAARHLGRVLASRSLGVAAQKAAALQLAALGRDGERALVTALSESAAGLHSDLRVALLAPVWHIAAARGPAGLAAIDCLAAVARWSSAAAAAAAGADSEPVAARDARAADGLLGLTRCSSPDVMVSYATRVLLPLLSSADEGVCQSALRRAQHMQVLDDRPERAVRGLLLRLAEGHRPSWRIQTAAAAAAASLCSSANADTNDFSALAALVEALAHKAAAPTEAAGAACLASLGQVVDLMGRAGAGEGAGAASAVLCVLARSCADAKVAAVVAQLQLRLCLGGAFPAPVDELERLPPSAWHAGAVAAAVRWVRSLVRQPRLALGAVEAALVATAARAAPGPQRAGLLRLALEAMVCAVGQERWTMERRAALAVFVADADAAVSSSAAWVLAEAGPDAIS